MMFQGYRNYNLSERISIPSRSRLGRRLIKTNGLPPGVQSGRPWEHSFDERFKWRLLSV